MNMSAITGAWGNTVLVCGNHPTAKTLPVMELSAESRVLTYVCPKCNAANLEEDEAICKNRLTAVDYEKMLNYVASMITDADECDEVPNLKNYQWRRKTLAFKILEHNGEKMTISVLDKTLATTE